MEGEIPIKVTKKKTKKSELIFKIASPQLIDHIQFRRTPTAPKSRPSNAEVRHQTLDPDIQPNKNRRISSSAASKRFPKDFFKDENCLNPIKSIRNRHKQYDLDMIDTFSHKNFIMMQVQEGDNIKINQEDTPKFTQKKGKQLSTKERLLQYIRFKKDERYTPTREKYSTCPQNQTKIPLSRMNHAHFQDNKLQVFSNPIIDNFNANFNLTLGQKQSLTTLIQKQSLKPQKKAKCSQKQNNNYLKSPLMQFSRRQRQNTQKVQGFRIRKKVI